MAQSAQAWLSISECARLYDRDRKWVYNRIKKYSIGTETAQDSNQRRLQLVDFIAHCGEPPNNGTPDGTGRHSETAQDSTPDGTATEMALLRQENAFLARRVQELEGDRDERKVREDRLAGIIERQTLTLPKPARQRFVDWWGSLGSG